MFRGKGATIGAKTMLACSKTCSQQQMSAKGRDDKRAEWHGNHGTACNAHRWENGGSAPDALDSIGSLLWSASVKPLARLTESEHDVIVTYDQHGCRSLSSLKAIKCGAILRQAAAAGR